MTREYIIVWCSLFWSQSYWVTHAWVYNYICDMHGVGIYTWPILYVIDALLDMHGCELKSSQECHKEFSLYIYIHVLCVLYRYRNYTYPSPCRLSTSYFQKPQLQAPTQQLQGWGLSNHYGSVIIKPLVFCGPSTSYYQVLRYTCTPTHTLTAWVLLRVCVGSQSSQLQSTTLSISGGQFTVHM